MKRIKNNQAGFGLLEWLLLLLIILILIAAGWFVWDSKKKTEESQQNETSAQSDPSKAVKPKDPTADWVTYSNAEGQFSFKHPKTWVQASNPELCNPGLALFGANAASVGKCATESFGQMSFGSNEGNVTAEVELSKQYYPDLVTEAVTINGVAGKKQTGSYKAPAGEEAAFVADGTKFIKYTFFTNNRTYSATYQYSDNYPDAVSDFNTLVTKTFKFQP